MQFFGMNYFANEKGAGFYSPHLFDIQLPVYRAVYLWVSSVYGVMSISVSCGCSSLESPCDFASLEASGADVSSLGSSILIHDTDLLKVRTPYPLCCLH